MGPVGERGIGHIKRMGSGGRGRGGRRTFRQSEQHARPGEKNFLSLERLQLCVHGMRDVERASSAGWKRFGWLRGGKFRVADRDTSGSTNGAGE